MVRMRKKTSHASSAKPKLRRPPSGPTFTFGLGGVRVLSPVLMLTVAVVEEFAVKVTTPGENEQLDAGGIPPQPSCIGSTKPETDEISKVNVAVWPAETVALGGTLTIEIPGAKPVPVRRTTWGLPAALSVIVNAPVLGPGSARSVGDLNPALVSWAAAELWCSRRFQKNLRWP